MRNRADSPSSPTIFLHIGTPKSGTTYLQTRIADNHKLALHQGLLWPGPRWGTHVEAVRELRTLRAGKRLNPRGPWMRLARTVTEWSGPRALISMEWMAGCTPTQVAAAVGSLPADQVHVIVTARDLLRSFVAQWQEMTKNCRPWGWTQFVDEVVHSKPGPAALRFWNQQDIPAILQRWAQVVPLERIHLVTVPPSGSDPDLLWQRFCSVIGLDGSTFPQPRRDNESLGVVSAELMYRVDVAAIAQGMTYEEYQRVLHRGLADEHLAPRRAQEQAIAVSPDVDAWVRARAKTLVEDTRALGVDVVGDLADLQPGKVLSGREPSDVGDDELLPTAIEAFVALSLSQHRALRQARSQNSDLRRQLDRRRGKPVDDGRVGVRRALGRGARQVARVARAGHRRLLARSSS